MLCLGILRSRHKPIDTAGWSEQGHRWILFKVDILVIGVGRYSRIIFHVGCQIEIIRKRSDSRFIYVGLSIEPAGLSRFLLRIQAHLWVCLRPGHSRALVCICNLGWHCRRLVFNLVSFNSWRCYHWRRLSLTFNILLICNWIGKTRSPFFTTRKSRLRISWYHHSGCWRFLPARWLLQF